MGEEKTVADKLEFMEGEGLITKFEAGIKLQVTKGGVLGKKWIAGNDQSTVPALVFITDQRLIFLSEFTTQKRMLVALAIPVPTSRKKHHTLYGEFAMSSFEKLETGWLGGAKITFSAHGALKQQFPKHSTYIFHIPDIKKKGAIALEKSFSTLKTDAPILPNSGCCELE